MPTTFEQTAARRVRYLRERLGWSQRDLADRLRNLGAPIDRASVARLETGKRGLSVDEAMRLAAALNVAPVHLLVDPDGDEPVQATPTDQLTPAEARDWIRGAMPLVSQDPRGYRMNVPRAEVEAGSVWDRLPWRVHGPEGGA
jgi:transcriptional regulator with XRE-family HTH domain